MGNNNRNSNDKNNYYNKQDEIKCIKEPLHIHYQDKAKLYLPEGIAYQKAQSFSEIPSHQLRKILNQTKICKTDLENSSSDFDKVKNQLFSILPLAAYNVGKASKKDKEKLNKLYHFLVENLNKKSITCKEDILVFDELFTSIIAYHKFVGGK